METFLNNLIYDQFIYYSVLSLLIILLMLLIILIVGRDNKKRLKGLEPITLSESPEEIKPEDLKNETEIEGLIKEMQEDLSEKRLDVTTFEQQQEEKSIISYQELLKNKIKTLPVSPTPYVNEDTEKLDLDFSVEPKKFTNSEFISPVYGRQDNNTEYPRIKNFNEEFYQKPIVEQPVYQQPIVEEPIGELEKTLNLKPLTEEIKKNDDFLGALKEFRRNLE